MSTWQRSSDYFTRAAEWARYTALTFHRGFAASGFDQYGAFHETSRHLASATRMGRGVVLVGPHQFCHELFAAMMLREHQLVGVVRQETRNVALIEHWYSQLEMPTIPRPANATAIADFRAMLRVLRDGGVLPILRILGLGIFVSAYCLITSDLSSSRSLHPSVRRPISAIMPLTYRSLGDHRQKG